MRARGKMSHQLRSCHRVIIPEKSLANPIWQLWMQLQGAKKVTVPAVAERRNPAYPFANISVRSPHQDSAVDAKECKGGGIKEDPPFITLASVQEVCNYRAKRHSRWKQCRRKISWGSLTAVKGPVCKIWLDLQFLFLGCKPQVERALL